MAEWIYISPHLDDAILSCGSLIWHQVQKGDSVAIWTVCASESPYPNLSPFAQTLHDRWQTGTDTVALRRKEDSAACLVLGADYSHLPYFDCIYRQLPDGNPVVTCDIELFIPPEASELDEARRILKSSFARIPENVNLVSPLGMGGHRDHRLVRMLLEEMFHNIYYFADYPYIDLYQLDISLWTENMQVKYGAPISVDGLLTWQNAVACYQSQISSFWLDETDMRRHLERYSLTGEGNRLWGIA